MQLDLATLDHLHEQVNSLGGVTPPGDRHAEGYCNAIDEILDIIEQLGGMDPRVRVINARFAEYDAHKAAKATR